MSDEGDKTRLYSPEEANPEGTKDEDRTRIDLSSADQEHEATQFAPVAASKTTEEDTNLPVGTLINNNYRVTGVLKSGGMGSVYRGVEIGTGDPVAIKVVLPDLMRDPQTSLLFKREARTLRQLTHPAIVRYYNYVRDVQLDRYFLVMEFIDGLTLADYVSTDRGLSVSAAYELMYRLAEGLGAAHDLGVVHRDLSPDNVMLPAGRISDAQLIDFGIARSDILANPRIDNQFAGKLKYVAPEQLGLFGGEAGPRADIYGLALLIIAALRGKPLAMGASIEEAIDARARVPDLHDLPQKMRPILAQMLAPDPADRPADMAALREMIAEKLRPRRPAPAVPGLTRPPGLDGVLPPGPAAATPVAPADLAPRDPMPVRLLFAMVLVFVVILGGAGWYGWQEGWIAPSANRPAVGAAVDSLPPRQEVGREAFLARYAEAGCSYAHRIATGPRAGMISVMTQEPDAMPELSSAYEAEFGIVPGTLALQVSPAQCAALDFAKLFQARPGPDLDLMVATTEIVSGQTVKGRLAGARDAQIWTALIDAEGRVYNLGEQIQQRALAFGLSSPRGATTQTQLVLSIATPKALVGTALLQDGSDLGAALEQIEREIRETGGEAAVRVSGIVLQPSRSETAPENNE
ncbi:serine/threonine protein kinase [Tritonibacter scottomollicae]|uniref:serine/threonine protein kinase n=1 Tax=Tritonibacter scottomollicae TaxID=483013 RepID=UPI003AA95608